MLPWEEVEEAKASTPGPRDCLQVFGREETEVEDGGRARHTSSTILRELRVLLSRGVEIPWARMKKTVHCISLQIHSQCLACIHINTHSPWQLSLVEIEKNILLCNYGKELGLSHRNMFKRCFSKRPRSWLKTGLCVLLSPWETNTCGKW